MRVSTSLPILSALALASFAPAACSPDAAPPSVSSHLEALGTCQAVESKLRAAAIQTMKERLQQNMDAALQYAGACGGLDDADTGGGAPQPPPSGEDQGGASQTSGTNNQVAGVDEPDFVKNDSNYLYLAAGGKLRIVDAWPPEQAHAVSETAIEGTPKKLFVSGDRALVYSSLDPNAGDDTNPYDWWRPSQCTYGYSCSFTGDGYPTKVTILDLSDRSQPAVDREIWLSGSLITARRIGSAVHTVVSDAGPTFEGLTYWPEELSWCGEYDDFEIYAAFSNLLQKNLEIIESAPADDWLPHAEDSDFGPIQETCEGFYASSLDDGDQITSVLSLDLQADQKARMTSIVSRPGAVYASSSSLYMAVPHQQLFGGWFAEVPEEEASTVHEFDLLADPPKAKYRGSGVVKGHVLNQFAMDEHEGHLRIATTTGHVPDPSVHSTLTVLRPIGHDLVTWGQIDGIAPGEDIRSVRFDGDRGFVVTFKKTDPLFAFDLSEPNDPKLSGELQIPGFSTYMHLMDEDHLLTIGYDADDQGSFAWFQGVLLQIFDVSDPSSPVLLHKHVIGTRGSSSEALTNHLAFTYFAPRDLLALPMTICEDSAGGGSYGDQMTFSGLMVFDATTEDGFAELGRVPHPTGDDVTCYNWWTNASSQVKRSVIMDDYVFSISDSLVKANAIDDLDTDLAVVPLTD